MKKVKNLRQATATKMSGEDDLEPGIYRMVATACETKRIRSKVAKCLLELKPIDPRHSSKRAVVLVELWKQADRARALRMFAMTGIVIHDEDDVEDAFPRMVGREYYVERLLDGRFHIQQLATTHQMTTPMSGTVGRIMPEGVRPVPTREDASKSKRSSLT
jgi:hypothetical protein